MKTKLYAIKSTLFLFLFFIPTLLKAQGNNIIEISGQIIDHDNKQPLPDVNVLVNGTVSGTSTNQEGKFVLRTKAKYPFKISVSSIGFQTQEFDVSGPNSNLNIALVTQTILGREVVVTASRVEESILKSPVAIEKLDIRSIRESPAPSFYDALENVKGVQMTTSSLTFKIPNTRGFNIPSNYRFMQMVDGVDMQAATLGVPLGNAIGPTELDIASVEITPGAASALYGMNAINGMSNLITKSPFRYQGLSVYQKGGINHIGGTGRDLSNLTETAIRYAKAFNDKWAFKVNLSYLRGIDWLSDTRLDQNSNDLKSANPSFQVLDGVNNIAYDAWNKYGDDVLSGSNTVSVSGLTINGQPSQTLNVARTGYYEKDLVSPNVDNLKFDAAIHYRVSEHAELSYTYRVGKMDGVFQRGNKIQLNNVVVQNHKLELKGSNFLVRTYVSLEDSGDSFNVKPLADNMDLYGDGTGTNAGGPWGTKFKNALNAYAAANGGALNNTNLAAASAYARQIADAGRAVPGTQAFEDLKQTIITTNNWDIKSAQIPDAPATGGAALVQKSNMYHAEGQWDLSKTVKIFDLLVGGDARLYEIIPDGNSFVDFSRPIADRGKPLADGTFGNKIHYKKVGAFAQVTKAFFEEKLKLFGSLRWDYNPEFKPKFTPRIAGVYSPDEHNNFRVTYQQGYRFPGIFEALSYVNNGRVKRVGSLSYINEGLGYLENSYTRASGVTFNSAVNAAVAAGANRNDAALANRNLLQVANLSAARPEKINSFEIGYKSILAGNKLVLDIDAYTNTYNGFLGQVQVDVPKGVAVGSDAAVLNMLDANRDAGQDRYRVYTNAKNTYRNFGSALGFTYNFYKKFTIAGNTSFNKMKTNATEDVFVTGFNTPEWSTNVSFGNREILPNFGFNIVWKWQQAFKWESPLVTATVPAFNTFDAQMSYKIPQAKAFVKVGGTNIFNKNYIQYAGGPTLGALYYAAITFEGLLVK